MWFPAKLALGSSPSSIMGLWCLRRFSESSHVILSKFVRIAATMLLVVGILLPSVSQSQQDDDSGEPIMVVHRQIPPESISQVGTPMSIQIELRNTYDIDAKVRLVGAKDGRFIDIAFPRGALNEADHPTFSIEIPSPIAAMSYQFVVHQRDGTLSSSKKFTIRRDCIQNFKVTVPEGSPNSEFRKEVSSLISQAKILERDTISLESSLRLLDDIKSSLSN
jgi:hypothetical protein